MNTKEHEHPDQLAALIGFPDGIPDPMRTWQEQFRRAFVISKGGPPAPFRVIRLQREPGAERSHHPGKR
jgi:hypothetical protein